MSAEGFSGPAGGRRCSPAQGEAVSLSVVSSAVSSLRPKSTPTPTGSFSVNGMPMEAVDYERLKQVEVVRQVCSAGCRWDSSLSFAASVLQDILDEMKKELSKLKEELIDGRGQKAAPAPAPAPEPPCLNLLLVLAAIREELAKSSSA